MPNPTNKEILEKIKGLHALTEEKFRGVHHRLDILNGQTAKNTHFRLLHLGAYKIIALLSGVVVALLALMKDLF